MATAAFCASRASFAAPARADAARGPAGLVRWRPATPRASPAPPFAEPSSTRIDARGVGAGVARLRRIARRAVVDARHPLASFDDGDARRDATERAPPDDAAESARDDELSTDARFGDARDDASRSAVSVLATTSAPKKTFHPEAHQTERETLSERNPWWVSMLNDSLESHPGFVLLGFVLVDMGSALVLLALITRFAVPVDGDFALAYAVSKSIRAPRLALDAVVAGWLAKAFPALAAVRVGPILDAGIELGAKLGEVVSVSRRRFFSVNGKRRETPKRGAPREKKNENESRRARAAREAREMTDAYGLAYMAAKNIIGPVSIALFYVLLKHGVDLRGALAFAGAGAATGANGAAAAAGKTAGALALASWVSTLFFPLVVLGAGFIGPKMGRGAEWVARGAWRGGAEAARGADAA